MQQDPPQAAHNKDTFSYQQVKELHTQTYDCVYKKAGIGENIDSIETKSRMKKHASPEDSVPLEIEKRCWRNRYTGPQARKV